MTDKISRTSAATAARMRASEEKAAARLRERGWLCIPDYPRNPHAPTQMYAIDSEGRAWPIVGWVDGNPLLRDGPNRPAFEGYGHFIFAAGATS